MQICVQITFLSKFDKKKGLLTIFKEFGIIIQDLTYGKPSPRKINQQSWDNINLADYILTDHALLAMRRRNIGREEIKKVMISPEQRLDIRKGRCVYQSRLAYGESTRDFLVRVFVDTDREPNEVVTVYRTRKIDKYWR